MGHGNRGLEKGKKQNTQKELVSPSKGLYSFHAFGIPYRHLDKQAGPGEVTGLAELEQK
jgi:hypothetical protein